MLLRRSTVIAVVILLPSGATAQLCNNCSGQTSTYVSQPVAPCGGGSTSSAYGGQIVGLGIPCPPGSGPYGATGSTPGMPVNGTSSNGSESNGLATNGSPTNGTAANGTKANGTTTPHPVVVAPIAPAIAKGLVKKPCVKEVNDCK